MLRGEIRIVDFGRAQAAEPAKRRPAVIVSNDSANTIAARLGRGAVTVIPVTSNTDHVYAFQVFLPASVTGLPVDSKASADQVTTVSMARVQDRAGVVPHSLMLDVDEALRIHLAL